MGIRKHAGRWHARWTDEIGRDHKKVMPAGSTKEQAEGFLRDVRVRVDRIKAGLEVRQRNPDGLRVREACARWLKAKKRNPRDEDIVRVHVVGTPLADELLERVTPARINAHLASLRPSTNAVRPVAELSAGSKNHVRKHLISIFKLAIARGWLIGENPARASAREKVKRRTLVTLTAAESMRLVAVATFPWNAIIALGLSGLRRGEIWGADVEDVDDAAWVIRVRHSHDRETKSGRERVVPVHPAYRPLLEEAIQAARGTVLLPATKAGERRSEKSKGTREFRAALVAAGIKRRVRFHDLRHTCATLMIQAGAQLQHVKDLLGHSSIAITSDLYGHLLVEDVRAALERVQLTPEPEGASK